MHYHFNTQKNVIPYLVNVNNENFASEFCLFEYSRLLKKFNYF